jgi:hypothetical protein
MTDIAENLDLNTEVDHSEDETRNEVIITLEGRDITIPMNSLSVNMESTPNEILDAVRNVVSENDGTDLTDDNGEVSFTVRKAMNTNTIYVYPKPVAG